ncbi:hypothetical protein DBR42_20205 [Pelomonas sp. HMWF004]|nr:hypothetical protein DBR42_20205 [Pelomonas sp. HMWF004]
MPRRARVVARSLRKTNMARHGSLLACIGVTAALLGAQAGANTVQIGFEDGPYASAATPYGPTSGTNNFSTEHFLFSPGCHFDWVSTADGAPAPFGHWLGFDTSGCYDPSGGVAGGNIGYNTNYLGPGGPVLMQSKLFVQQEFGAQFTLESFVFATVDSSSGGLEVRSSKGGFFTTGYPDGNFAQHMLSGAKWTDVDWLEFRSIAPGVPVGFDNLVLSSNAVPEPGALHLALLAFAAAGLSWRVRKS